MGRDPASARGVSRSHRPSVAAPPAARGWRPRPRRCRGRRGPSRTGCIATAARRPAGATAGSRGSRGPRRDGSSCAGKRRRARRDAPRCRSDSSSGSKLSIRDQSPVYGSVGTCACIPTRRSITAIAEAGSRRSSIWRSRMARFSCRRVRTGAVTRRAARWRGRGRRRRGTAPGPAAEAAIRGTRAGPCSPPTLADTR